MAQIFVAALYFSLFFSFSPSLSGGRPTALIVDSGIINFRDETFPIVWTKSFFLETLRILCTSADPFQSWPNVEHATRAGLDAWNLIL